MGTQPAWYRGAGLLAAALIASTIGAVSGRYDATAHAQLAIELGETPQALDAVFARAWQAAGVMPEPEAPWALQVRRVSLALVGSAPSLEEMRALERLDERMRLPAMVERLLADRRFADYFAERFARAFVGTDDGPFLVYRRRRFVHWLSDALHEGMPYDALVRELVSAEGLWTDTPATNFVTAHERDPVRLTARSARAFLGIRLDCAQCHDHPFSHWKQADFEGLAAFYAGIDQRLTGVHDEPGEFRPGGRMMVMGTAERPTSPRVPFDEALLDERGRLRERLAGWMTASPSFARATANRVWTLLLGSPLTRGAVDDLESGEKVPGALDLLAADFRDHGHDLRRLVRLVTASRAFRVGAARENGSGEAYFAAFPLTKLRGEQIAGTLAQLASLSTIDEESHVLLKLVRFGSRSDFAARYGDAGEAELAPQAGTLAQRLTMMNGNTVAERIEAGPFSAVGRIAGLAPDDAARVRLSYLVALSREPSEAELARFTGALAGKNGEERRQAMEDLMWSLVNATELSWNH